MLYIFGILILIGLYLLCESQFAMAGMDLAQICQSLIDGLTTYDRLTPAHVVAFCVLATIAFAIGQRTLAFVSYGVVVIALAYIGVSVSLDALDAASVAPQFEELMKHAPTAVSTMVAALTGLWPKAPVGEIARGVQPWLIVTGCLCALAAFLVRRKAVPAILILTFGLCLMGAAHLTYEALSKIELPSVARARLIRACTPDIIAGNVHMSSSCLALACESHEKGNSNLDLRASSLHNPKNEAPASPNNQIMALCSAQHT